MSDSDDTNLTSPSAPGKKPGSASVARGFRTSVLAVVLSLILIAGWAIYLLFAPTPDYGPPAAPTAEAVTRPPDQLRLLAWRNAVDTGVLDAFTADTGLTVAIDGYNTNEQLQALAASGGITHDIVLVSGIGLKALVDEDALRDLPKGDVARAANLDPALAGRTTIYDPLDTHAIPILWGTIGLAFNAAKIAERLGPDAVVDSWSVLFDPVKAAKLADCGIQVIDSPTGVFPLALKYLGLPPDSAKAEDTEAAARLWENIRPSVALFSSQNVIDNLANGKVCLAMATSGDAFQARDKARAAGMTNDIRYVLPKEGAVVWYDFLAIPKASANTAGALRLIDYVLRPEVAARLTNAKGFANTVVGAGLYVKPEIKTDAALMPDLAKVPNIIEEIAPSPAAAALRNRFWQLINGPPASAAPAAKPGAPK